MAPVETSDERLKAAVRQDAREWIEAHWDPTLELTKWRRQLHESSWACPTWPRECGGRGLPSWAHDIVKEELAAAGAVGTPLGSGMDLAAPTIWPDGSPAINARSCRGS